MSLYNKIIDLQKLNAAWGKARVNKPSAGVDGVTWDMYDSASADANKELCQELRNKTYECKPVKLVTIYKEDKERQIALYCMRDKVVQQSLAEELRRIYDGNFSTQTYAYRANKSALLAVAEIDKKISAGKYKWVLKIDIRKFFDTMQWGILERILREKIREDDVINLIRMESCSASVDKDGELTEKTLGIYQGSSIAPILSNIYLMKFDYEMMKSGCYYLRYSDDMLLLGETQEDMTEAFEKAQNLLSSLGLTISEKKTILTELKNGVDFLGYHFDENGKAITAKAEQQLSGRLETIWLMNRNEDCEVRLRKMSEVLNGWEQYFRGNREIGDILEYATVVSMVRSQSELMQIADQRRHFTNIYQDIATYLMKVWKDISRFDLILAEYEQLYGFCGSSEIKGEAEIAGLLKVYEDLEKEKSKDNFIELMQLYSDLHQYDVAGKISSYIDDMDAKKEVIHENVGDVFKNVKTSSNSLHVPVTDELIDKFMNLFVGREDMYALVDYVDGKKQVRDRMEPLSKDTIRKHLQGECIVASFNQRQNSTVKTMMIDLDISKRVLIECAGDKEKIGEYLKGAADVTLEIGKWFHRKNIEVRYEFSGYRGYHIWIFFDKWIPTYYVNMLQDILEKDISDKVGNDFTLEFFPNKTKLKTGKNGQCIKLPLSINSSAGVHSALLNNDLSSCGNELEWMDNAPRYTVNDVKKILAVKSEQQDESLKRVVDEDLQIFGDIPSNVSEILGKCNLMRYLCRKAHDTGYLTHFERLSVLYVFAHVGEEGQRFVHQIMSYTLNYKYNVTERFIRKCPEKPVSCGKLREQYKRVTAEIGCNCIFKRSQKCYPSPVLHAISLSTDEAEQVTLPISQTLTKEKSQSLAEEMNVHKKAQSLAVKIVELKKQRRGIDNSVRKIERELERIFDEQDTDSLELEMGILVRRKRENGYEWLIEI